MASHCLKEMTQREKKERKRKFISKCVKNQNQTKFRKLMIKGNKRSCEV